MQRPCDLRTADGPGASGPLVESLPGVPWWYNFVWRDFWWCVDKLDANIWETTFLWLTSEVKQVSPVLSVCTFPGAYCGPTWTGMRPDKNWRCEVVASFGLSEECTPVFGVCGVLSTIHPEICRRGDAIGVFNGQGCAFCVGLKLFNCF